MHATRSLNTGIRSPELPVKVDWGPLVEVLADAGVVDCVVVELTAAGAGVALTSPTLEHRLKSLLLLPIVEIVETRVCVWAKLLQRLMSPS